MHFPMNQICLKIMHCPFNPNNFTKVSIWQKRKCWLREVKQLAHVQAANK